MSEQIPRRDIHLRLSALEADLRLIKNVVGIPEPNGDEKLDVLARLRRLEDALQDTHKLQVQRLRLSE